MENIIIKIKDNYDLKMKRLWYINWINYLVNYIKNIQRKILKLVVLILIVRFNMPFELIKMYLYPDFTLLIHFYT